jgi:outer membrane protein assembly factor BamA
VDFGLEYRNETHGTLRPRTPWSLLDNNEPWRAQPHVAEGDLNTLRGWVRWDTRNDRENPSSGWLLEAEAEQGLEGDLRIATPDPASTPTAPLPPTTRAVGAEFTTIRLDTRRYLRLGPRTRVALRAVLSGSPDDGALPPQRQHTLGGEGSIPGYDRFAQDCGAREAPLLDDLIPYYGCDRSVLIQAEGRVALGSGFSLGRLLGLDFELLTTPELVIFADAGRAWIEEESLGERVETGSGAFRYDAGLGIRLGRLGAYLAVPFSEEGSDGPNFFIRLGPRL